MSKPTRPEKYDHIDELLDSSWQLPPTSLLKRVKAIPVEQGAPVPVFASIRELVFNAAAYVLIYAWLVGMFMIFKTTLLASVEKLGVILQKLVPSVNLPETGNWIPVAILFLLGALLAARIMTREQPYTVRK